MAEAEASAQLAFPVPNANSTVVVPLEHLDYDKSVDDAIDLLTSEAQPPLKWYQAATAFLKRGDVAAYDRILSEALHPETVQQIVDYYKQPFSQELVQLHCASAALSIEQLRTAHHANEKNTIVQKANNRITAARGNIGAAKEQLPHLAQGYLSLVKGDATIALREFQAAEKCQHHGRDNIAPLLAQAELLFDQGRVPDALQLYVRALQKHPAAPAEVRLGLAACCHRLGHMDKAAACYTRVLELDPENADALLGLATIKSATGSAQQGMASAMELLSRAFQADPDNAGVLLALAHYKLLKGDYDAVLNLASAAESVLEGGSARQRAQAALLQARAYHAKGQQAEAKRLYGLAARLDAKMTLPHLGIAQMALAAEETTNAATELQAVLDLAPGNIDALRLLGQLIKDMPDRVERSLSLFREAAEKKQEDAEMQELYAELASSIDPQASVAAYNKAVRLHMQKKAAGEAARQKALEKQQKAASALEGSSSNVGSISGIEVPAPYYIPLRLLNNAAVMRYRSGDVAGARELLLEAEAVQAAGQGGEGLSQLAQFSILYNRGRVQEAAGDLKAAKGSYQQLLEFMPGYPDTYLRMAHIAKETSGVEEAIQWVLKAREHAGAAGMDAQAMLVHLALEAGDLGRAKEELTKLQEAFPKEAGSDPYCRLLSAQLQLLKLPSCKGKDKEKQLTELNMRLNKALRHYMDLLQQDKARVHAANGLGVCFAELGHLDAAKEAFTKVQESAVAASGFLKIPDATINLGSLALARGDPASALKLYDRASKHFHHRNVQVLMYIARCHYDKKDFAACKAALLKAMHIDPLNYKVRFDVALTCQEYASYLLIDKTPSGAGGAAAMRTNEQKKEEFEGAAESLNIARSLFENLVGLGKAVTGVDAGRLEQHIKYCATTVDKVAAHIELLERKAQEETTRRVAQQVALDKERARRTLEDQHKRALELAAEAQKREAARRQLEEDQKKLQEWRTREVMAAAGAGDIGGEGGGGSGKGSKKKKKGKAAADEFETFIDDGVPQRQPKNQDERDVLKRAGLDSDEDEPAVGDDDLFGEGDEEAEAGGQEEELEEMEDGEQQAGAGSGGGRLKRRAAAAAEGAEDDLEEEDVEAAAAAGGAGPDRKRARGAALEDSDEEEAGEGQQPQPAAEAGAAMEEDDDDLFGV